jgi:ferredoxin
MITASEVKRVAREHGADMVGIASMDRFEGAPPQMDARRLLPSAKSMVVMGFRHFRGCFRGIEEGTFYTTYAAMGYASINYIYQPLVLWHLSKVIEDAGYDALPIPNNFPWLATDVSGQDPTRTGKPSPTRSRPVAPGKPAPDVFIQLRLAAFCAGLGEIGWSKMFLSPQLGPRQRLAAILTDAPLEPDPVFSGTLCDRCLACVKACSVGAIPKDKTVKVRVAGRDLEWADIDMEACSVGFCGGAKAANPFMVTPEDETGFTQEVGQAQQHKLPPIYVYARALEGASGCIRACMIHLEQQGKLENRFVHPFRKRQPWRL